MPKAQGSSLVGGDARSLERLGTQLLILVRDEMDAERELVDTGTLTAQIKAANLGIRYTTVEARLGIWLPFASEYVCCNALAW